MKCKKMAAVLLAGAVLASAAMTGCGTDTNIDPDAAVATLGDKEVSLGYANFAARYQQATYDQMFVNYYGTEYWHSDQFKDEEGNDLEAATKKMIMDDIELNYLLEAHMADYGVEISEEEMAAIKAAAKQFMEDNTASAIETMGATQEYVEDLLYYTTVRSKMTAAIRAEADTNVSDEECSMRTFSYIKVDTAGTTDEEGNYVEYSEDEKAEAVAELKLAAEKAADDFEGAASANEYEINTHSYHKADEAEADGFPAAVFEAADKLKEGGVSELIQDENTYYIVRLDSADDKEAAETERKNIISQRQDDLFAEVTEGYRSEADFQINEDQWKKVVFDNIFVDANAQPTAPTETEE